MKVLLDTHVLLRWLFESSTLRRETRDIMSAASTELLWSAASTWELGIKLQLGRLRLDEPFDTFVVRILAEQSLLGLPVQHAHAVRAAMLPPLHRDPFDRMLVAQAIVEHVPLLTRDKQLGAYGVDCIDA